MIYNYTEMWPERLKRILLVAGGAVIVLLAAKGFSDWQAAKTVKGESIELPTQLVVDKLEEVGQEVLGKAIEVLPGAPLPTRPADQAKEKVTEKETTKIIETQTKEIMEIIKQLPQSQVDQIKKQVFKDFCQEVLGK